MEELFNVDLVIMYGFINQKLSNLKMKLKLKYQVKNLTIMSWKIKKMITLTKNYQKQKIQNLENVANTGPTSVELINENKKTTFSVSKFLSYFLVFLITFIALIIVLDTFKSPLSSIIPGLEIFLYNFFETLKDLYLFIKNLLS
jgi:small-conductance mechanosensitive channel